MFDLQDIEGKLCHIATTKRAFYTHDLVPARWNGSAETMDKSQAE
jgi:hypothetical protein